MGFGLVAAATVALSAMGTQQGSGGSAEACAIVSQDAGGKRSVVEDPGLSVINETKKAGPFAYPLPETTIGLRCVRQSLVPATDDHEVLQRGLQLYLADSVEGGEASVRGGFSSLLKGSPIFACSMGRSSPPARK